MELKGIAASTGIVSGEALVVEREAVPVFRLALPPGHTEAEIDRLQRAVDVSRRQVEAIRERLARELPGPHAIFDAHLMMLQDPLLVGRAAAVIREEKVNAEWALRSAAEQLYAVFEEFTDPYLRERSRDLDDVLGRLLINLGGAQDAPSLGRLPGPVVLVASALTPSDAAELDWKRVLGVALEQGSPTQHAVILARSRGVPAVVGLEDVTRRVLPGVTVVVDGTRGRVVVEPSAPALARVRAAQERDREEEQRLLETRTLPAVTVDGRRVCLRANVEFLDEAAVAAAQGAEGIGLFRSEYLLGRARQWPSEDRQVEAYTALLGHASPHPVTVRTWDVGPEDLAPGGPSSPNPALGERALRLLHRAPETFRAQLRALWQAAARGPMRVMFPFLSGPSDLRQALELLEESAEALRRDGRAVGGDLPVGVNVEIPSAALTIDLLPAPVAFLSLGTNDLVQFTLAADRSDPRVAAHYQPLHPAVLRLVHEAAERAAARGLPLAACGEMAGHPLTALLLLGLGVQELSMRPPAIPRVKAAIRAARLDQAREVARACLALPTAEEIERVLRGELGNADSAGTEAVFSA